MPAVASSFTTDGLGDSLTGYLPFFVYPALLVGGPLGEELGWRGFALPLLQRRRGPLGAALLVTPIRAVWHVPYFLTITTYRDMTPPAYIGFVFGLACGSIVLTWIYNRSGGSILACAVWHGLFNVATGAVTANGPVAAMTSMLVILQALLLVALEMRARSRGRASVFVRAPAAGPA